MKFNFETDEDKKFLHHSMWVALLSLIVGMLVIGFAYLTNHSENVSQFVSNILKILSPLIDGLIIAFLLTPVVNFFERRLFPALITKKRKQQILEREREQVEWLQNVATAEEKELFLKKENKKFKLLRALSILLSLLLLGLLIYAFLYAVIPQIKSSIENIVTKSGMYYRNVQHYLNKLAMKHPDVADVVIRNWDLYYDKIIEWRDNTVIPIAKGWLVTASSYIVKFFSAIWNVIIGLIISIYIVAGKEKLSAQFKKIFYGLFGTKTANHLINNIRFTNEKFSGFIVGKLVDSLIIGVITFVCCTIFKFDYPVLIALIIGVTNVIPFFGPIFGAIPCFILLFMISPIKSLYFVLFVIVLQQFDGNILGPKILGESTGVSGLWVIVSITFFGGIWNVPGMIVGVPLFAVLYAGFKTLIERSLHKKSLPTETNDFYNLNYIDPETNKPILHSSLYHIKKAQIQTGQINIRDILHKRYLKQNIKDYFKKK